MILTLLNNAMPYIGFVLCLLVWRLEQFNTKPFSIQTTLILLILAMIMLYLADHNPTFMPIFSTVVSRYLILMSVVGVSCYVYTTTRDVQCLQNLIDEQAKEIQRLKSIQ